MPMQSLDFLSLSLQDIVLTGRKIQISPKNVKFLSRKNFSNTPDRNHNQSAKKWRSLSETKINQVRVVALTAEGYHPIKSVQGTYFRKHHWIKNKLKARILNWNIFSMVYANGDPLFPADIPNCEELN